jgi:ribosomal protein L28
MKELEIKKILGKKIKPLVGNNRSRTGQARRVTKRKFATNRQKFRVGSKVYNVPVKVFRAY